MDETVLADSAIDTLATQQTPAPATGLAVKDKPGDVGGAVRLTWNASVDDGVGGKVRLYRILRADDVGGQAGEFREVGNVPAGAAVYTNDDGNTDDDKSYFYRVQSVNVFYDENADVHEYTADSEIVGPVSSSAQWFNSERLKTLIGTIVLSFFIIFFINQAKAGKKLFIRKMAGMEAVDEAVGRATEMGKKIFYITGLGDMDNMQTIASITILGRVAQLAAEYETYLDVPCCRSMVMVTAREVVKEAHSKAGRPDAYNDDMIHYLTDDQFGYAAAVDGAFVREKPATIFFMGQFFAESLILAETGNSIGAIQIAGTAMPSQLPFFVAACDYTLIGEELFAASAYLSREPKLLGSLKGQDYGKAILLVAIVVGLVLETLGVWQLSNLFQVIGE
ncbi:MAG: DUF6754 domain-containing protein [bacterium]